MQPDVESPFSSIEVRWFFDVGHRDTVKSWFEEYSPVARSNDVRSVEWAGRKGDEPDTYLLLPGYPNMGIKWREGTLQVKGLVADVGDRSYAGRHEGHVQRWIKWTYAEVPEPLRALFLGTDEDKEVLVPVSKTRAVRLIEIEQSGEYIEVPGSKWIGQGVAFEMTDLQVRGRDFCTVGFEAFPDSTAVRDRFDDIVGEFLTGLEAPLLSLDLSMSYPSWLNGRLT